jgi:hypothetical protein
VAEQQRIRQSESCDPGLAAMPDRGNRRLPTRDIQKEQPVLDVILLAVGLAFFALSIAYAYACDRL